MDSPSWSDLFLSFFTWVMVNQLQLQRAPPDGQTLSDKRAPHPMQDLQWG